MKFYKYNSIENSYQTNFIQSIYLSGFGDKEYVVQEKVHGANLSFITDGKKVSIAKRTGFIETDESFYNAIALLKRYKKQVKSLFDYLSKSRKIDNLTIFGELFGGGYPHAEVASDDSAKLIQQGIYYCPNNEFYAFDILIDGKEYLDFDEANV